MAELVARIDGTIPLSYLLCSSFDVHIYSSFINSLRGPKRGIYAICIPMDELFADAGNQRAEYYQDVGHLPCNTSLPLLNYSPHN